MFDSIMPYRPQEASLLSRQLSDGTFPQAVLFAGPAYGGRLTIAMECARILSCEGDRSDTCPCRSCRDFNTYGMPNVVTVGNRDHWTHIDAALELYARLGTERARLQLVRAIRIMLLQYHGALLESADSKNTAVFNAASAVDEALLTIDWDAQGTGKRVAQLLGGVLKPLRNLMKRSQALTIGQVRAMQEWTAQTSFGNSKRFIILEGIEQSTDGARNSLLKLLEEPPAHTYIMLISEHPSRLLATILSRVQRHHIGRLSEERKNRLLSDLYFIDGSAYESVEQFMLTSAGIPCVAIKESAKILADASARAKSLARSELDVLGNELDEPVRLGYFLKEFEHALRQQFLDGTLTPQRASRLVSVVNESAWKAMTYNQGGRMLLESLHYRLLEVS